MAAYRRLMMREVLDPLLEAVDIDMLESMKIHGVVNPIIVYEKDGVYVIADGKKRFACLKALNHGDVPCVIITENEALAAGTIESGRYSPTPPDQYLKAIKSVLKTESLEELCRKVGRSDVEMAKFCGIPVDELRKYGIPAVNPDA